jgi:cholest-4-en-3-one 26-monooxygenase
MTIALEHVDVSSPDTFVPAVPHEMFETMRREDPVHWNEEADGRGFWSITTYDDLHTCSRDHANFSSERGGITLNEIPEADMVQQRLMMLMMDPPKHTKLRLLVNKGFTPRMIGRLEEHIRDLARGIVDAVVARGECDFVVDVAAELPLQVIAEMMGVPQEDRHKVFEWSNRMIGSEDPEYNVSPDQAFEAAAEMFMYANNLAMQKRRSPGDDIISVLLQAEVDGEQLTEMEFDLFFELLAIAGNETTRNLISHGMLFLIEHPDARRALRDDPTLVDTAVEEMLRCASPVMYMRRTAQADVQVRDKLIHAGDKVALWYISANRDESVFPDSNTFDIRRTPNEHVAFGGGGPHFCLGANLARLEARIMFGELARRIADVDLDGPVQRLRSNFINGIKHMPLSLTGA